VPANAGTNSVGVQSEGEAEGGRGGNSASPEPKRSPAALLIQSRIQQKSFLFLLPARRSLGAGGEEKIGGAQIKKCKENFSLAWQASASGGGAERQFRSKKFRAKFRISHDEDYFPGQRLYCRRQTCGILGASGNKHRRANTR